MTDGTGEDRLRALARDWATLWQSELTALACDREAQEGWQALLGLWGGAAGALLGDGSDRRAGTATPARAAAAAAAPDARDAEIERLAGRVAELERRLAELDDADRRRRRERP